MSTDTATDTFDVAATYGPIAAREYEDAKDCHKPKLLAWLTTLPTLNDHDFRDHAESAIHGSALVNSWRGNWEHEHCRASAAHSEAKRRHVAAGHSDDCRGDDLYSQAFRSVWRSQGHDPSAYEPQPCTCGRAAVGSSDKTEEG